MDIGQLFSSLGIEPKVFFAQLISFLILLFLLRFFLFGPMTEVMTQRKLKIDGDLDSANKENENAKSLRAEYEKKLAEISEEARQRVAQSVADANAAAKRIKDKADEEIAELTARHEAKLAAERLELKIEIKNEAVDLAVEIAGKALRNHMTPDLQKLIVADMMKELEQSQLN